MDVNLLSTESGTNAQHVQILIYVPDASIKTRQIAVTTIQGIYFIVFHDRYLAGSHQRSLTDLIGFTRAQFAHRADRTQLLVVGMSVRLVRRPTVNCASSKFPIMKPTHYSKCRSLPLKMQLRVYRNRHDNEYLNKYCQ